MFCPKNILFGKELIYVLNLKRARTQTRGRKEDFVQTVTELQKVNKAQRYRSVLGVK